MEEFLNGSDMPIGFGLALAMNMSAMERFANMPDNEKRAVIERARSAVSREEMQLLVNSIIGKN